MNVCSVLREWQAQPESARERQNGVEKIDCTRLWVEGYLAKNW